MGAVADLSILRWRETPRDLADVSGALRRGGCWEPVATIRAGELVGNVDKSQRPG